MPEFEDFRGLDGIRGQGNECVSRLKRPLVDVVPSIVSAGDEPQTVLRRNCLSPPRQYVETRYRRFLP